MLHRDLFDEWMSTLAGRFPWMISEVSHERYFSILKDSMESEVFTSTVNRLFCEWPTWKGFPEPQQFLDIAGELEAEEDELFEGRVHHLKCWPEEFKQMASGEKPFDVRKDDRDYQVGDHIVQQEWIPGDEYYTGEEVVVLVTSKLEGKQAEGFGLQPGYCVMGIALIGVAEDEAD